MQKKINKTQVIATLALAFVLGLAVVPNSASAMSAAEGARATTVDPTDTPITDTTKDSWKLAEATPEQLVSAISSVEKSSTLNNKQMEKIIYNTTYLETNECKYSSVCGTAVKSIIDNVPAGTDTTGWDTKPQYELVTLAKATTGYDTNDKLKEAVKLAEDQISESQLDLIAAIHIIDSKTSVSDLKAKTIPELITFAKAIPNYDKYVALFDASYAAIVFHESIRPDAESGKYPATAEAAKYYNDLVAAALAIDPSFEVTPVALPETSAPETDTPKTETTTKTPNTGIFGEGENKTAIAAVGGAAVLGVVAGILALRKTMKSKNRKARKF